MSKKLVKKDYKSIFQKKKVGLTKYIIFEEQKISTKKLQKNWFEKQQKYFVCRKMILKK